MYGHKDIKSIARFVGSRTATQVRGKQKEREGKIEKETYECKKSAHGRLAGT